MNTIFISRLIGIVVIVGLCLNVHLLYSQDDAISWFNRGATAQNTTEKITCYLQAISLDPKFIEAYYNLGYVYKNAGDLNNAEKAFRQALLVDPTKLAADTKLRITYELGVTLRKLNRHNEAIETLESAKNIARETEIRAVVLYELGRTKLAVNNFNDALTDFNEGLQLNSSKQDAFKTAIQNVRSLRELDNQYSQGMKLFDEGKYEQAIEILTRVVQSEPNYKNASQKLAEAQQLKDRQTKLDNLADVYARGIGYMQRSDWQNAILAFKQVEGSDPNYKDVKVKLAEAQARMDQSLQQEVYEKIYNDGQSEYRKGNWINAIVAFEKVKEWDPNYKNVDRMYRDAQSKLNREGESSVKNRYYVEGKTYLNNENWEAAITSFKLLKNLDQNYKDVQYLLQQAQAGLENQAKALQMEDYYAEGMNHYDNGDWLKAILSFEKIQQIDPNYKDISEKLVSAQANLNNTSVAEMMKPAFENQKLAKTYTKDWMLIGGVLSLVLLPLGVAFFVVPTTRAKLLLMQGNHQKAASIYESILMKKPNKVKLYPSLANIYLMLNRKDDTARKVYDIVLQMDISPQLRQKLDEITNERYLNNDDLKGVESLEEQLKRELLNLRSS